MMAKEIERSTSKLTLSRVDQDAVIGEKLKNLTEVHQMCRHIGAGDEEIVQVDEAIRQATEDLVHKSLKSLCSIPETEGHSDEFEQAEWGDDGSLGDVICVEGNLVIGSDEIDLREDCAASKLRREVLQVRDGVAIRHSCGIQGTVVTTRTPVTGGLRDHVER